MARLAAILRGAHALLFSATGDLPTRLEDAVALATLMQSEARDQGIGAYSNAWEAAYGDFITAKNDHDRDRARDVIRRLRGVEISGKDELSRSPPHPIHGGPVPPRPVPGGPVPGGVVPGRPTIPPR